MYEIHEIYCRTKMQSWFRHHISISAICREPLTNLHFFFKFKTKTFVASHANQFLDAQFSFWCIVCRGKKNMKYEFHVVLTRWSSKIDCILRSVSKLNFIHTLFMKCLHWSGAGANSSLERSNTKYISKSIINMLRANTSLMRWLFFRVCNHFSVLFAICFGYVITLVGITAWTTWRQCTHHGDTNDKTLKIESVEKSQLTIWTKLSIFWPTYPSGHTSWEENKCWLALKFIYIYMDPGSVGWCTGLLNETRIQFKIM